MSKYLVVELLVLCSLFIIPFFTGFIGFVIERARARGGRISPHVIGIFGAFGAPSVMVVEGSLEPSPFFWRLLEFLAVGSIDPTGLSSGLLFGFGIWGTVWIYFRYYEGFSRLILGEKG